MVQVIRGKDLISELVIDPRQVMYVESSPQEGDNVLFELIGGEEGEAFPIYHFLMAHGYDDESEEPSSRWTH